MKTILLAIAAAFWGTVCCGQDYVSIPYATALSAKVPLEYSVSNGSSNVKKKVEVELVIENFKAHHTEIKSYADGGLAGGFKCDIVFSTWFSYSSPKGFTVDGEFVSFDKLGIPGISFTVKDVRFRWIQGVNGQYEWFKMGSPLLPTNPKGSKPGYTGSVYLQLKEMIGDHGSCAKDIQVVKGKGPLYGYGLEIGEIVFNPPYELKKYLQQKAEKEIQEEKERKEREEKLYNSSGNSGPVLTRSSNSSSSVSSSSNNRYSSSNKTSGRSSGSKKNTYARKGYSKYWTKADNDAWLKKKAKELRRTYGRYRKEPPQQRSIYDHREPTSNTDNYFEKRALEKKKREEEAKRLNEQRFQIINEFPKAFQDPKYYNLKGGQKAYCFLYVNPGSFYKGRSTNAPGKETANMVISNVFAIEPEGNLINGAILRKEIELSINRQLAIQNGEDPRYQTDDYAGLAKYIVGPYGSEKDARTVLSQFKSRLSGTGVQIHDVQFTFKKSTRSELYQTAMSSFEKKNYKNALSHFERAALEYDSDPAVYMYIARCWYKIKPLAGNRLNERVVENFNKAMEHGATAEDYISMAEMFYNFRYSGSATYDFEAVWCYTKAAETGNKKAREWLEKHSIVIDKALIFYNPNNKKYGIRNLQNQVVVNAEYDNIVSDGRGLYKVQKGNLVGLIDKTGNVILPVKFLFIGPETEGIRMVKVEDYRYGYIDTTSVFITQAVFYKARQFSEGMAAVVFLDNQNVFKKYWGFIDKTGNMVIESQFTDAFSFSEGLAAVKVCNGGACKWGFINKRGEWVIPAKFRYVNSFENGKAKVTKGKKVYYIDKSGKKVK